MKIILGGCLNNRIIIHLQRVLTKSEEVEAVSYKSLTCTLICAVLISSPSVRIVFASLTPKELDGAKGNHQHGTNRILTRA